MKPQVVFPDVERVIVDHLTGAITGVPVSVGVPSGWTPAQGTRLQVALDGTPVTEWPVTRHHTVRVTAHAANTTAAKAAASAAESFLCATPWPAGVASIRPLTSLFPARDPDTNTEVASITVQVICRSTLAP